jgi:hypothetical protein
LHKAIIGDIDHCHFGNAINGLRIGDPGGSYVVGVTATHCTANNTADAHVLIGSADAEDICIRNWVFEAGTNTPALRGADTAIDGGNCNLYTLEFSGNWMGDASGAVDWVYGLRAQSKAPIMVLNNFFGDSLGTHFAVNSTATITAMGNRFAGGDVFDAASNAIMTGCVFAVIGNTFNNVNALFTTVDRPQQLTMLANANGYSTNPASNERTAFDTLPGRVALGAGKGTGTAGVGGISLTSPASPDNDYEQLLLGCHNQNALVAFPSKGSLYTQINTASGARVGLNLQSDSSDDDAWVRLVAGTTPTEVLKVDRAGGNTRVSFHGVTPLARPSAYTITNSVSDRSYDANATDVAELADVLATLITDLKNYGLLQ